MLAFIFGWQLYQMDVSSTILNGMIKEEVYINQLKGLRCMGKMPMYADEGGLVWVKQASLAWYSRICE